MEAQVADVVRIRLLGGFEASSGGRLVPAGGWRLRKGRTLVKLLALQPAHAMHVEQVCDVLWPDRTASAARNNLHQALHAARRAMTMLGVEGAAVLAMQDDLLSLGQGARVVVDVDELREAVRAAAAAGDSDRVAMLLQDAPGELLPEDAYEAWLQPHATAFREWRVKTVMEVVHQQLADGQPHKAAVLLTPVVTAEPLNEPATRLLMRALAGSGRRSEALLVYDRLRARLQDELAIDPEPQTRATFRELLPQPADPEDTTAPVIPAQRLPGNLPAPLSSPIGRGREVEEIASILARTRLLTLTGMGGVGKTTLALQVARRLIADYRDGVFLVELDALSHGEQVAPQIARALQLALPSDASPVGAIAAQLRGRQVLMLLDNCEHLLDECAHVTTELLRGCPELRILATSREPLRVDGELSWRTPSLALPDPVLLDDESALRRVASVALFLRRATASFPGFDLTPTNSRAVVEICHRLDGIPLALELAAACIPTLTPEQIAARLSDAISLLRHGGRASITRQQTLEATLSWSHELLSPDEQVVFRRLGVFAGSFTLDAVESICAYGRAAASVVTSLARLVDASLVAVDLRGEVTRYRLLDSVRQYAVQRLRAAGELEETEHLHCESYLAFVVSRDPELPPASTTVPVSFDAEHDNLRAALSWALAHRPRVALQLAVALWRYWLARGFIAEGRGWLEAALDANPDASPLRARALVALAAFDVRRGVGDRLRRVGAEAVTIHRASGDPAALAVALHTDALLAFMAGDWDDAWQRASESLDVAARGAGPEAGVGARHLKAIVLAERGQLRAARAAFEEVRAVLAALDDSARPLLRAVAQGFTVVPLPGEDARVYFEETVLHGRVLGTRQADAHVLRNLADVARAAGELDEALRLAEQAERLCATIGDADGEAAALNRRGCLHRVRGEFVEGRDALVRSLLLRRRSGERRAIAITESNLGLLTAAAGDVSAGRRAIEAQIASAADIRDVAGEVAMTLTLTSLEADAGDFPSVDARLRALDLPSRALPGDARATAWSMAMHAAAVARMGDSDETARLRAAARRRFTALRIVDGGRVTAADVG